MIKNCIVGRARKKEMGEGWGHQESNLTLYSNKEYSCTSAPGRSPRDAFTYIECRYTDIVNKIAAAKKLHE
jgi:hypothetical protein